MADAKGDKPDARVLLGSLVGREIPTMTGKPNRVLRLEGKDVIVATGKSRSGKPVPVADIQDAIDRLWRDGKLEISVASVGYRSAFVGAVLQTILRTVSTTQPRCIRLA